MRKNISSGTKRETSVGSSRAVKVGSQVVGAGTKAEGEDDARTPGQREVLVRLGKGCANKEIEDRLGLADRTVRAHLTVIFKHLGVQSRIRAVMEARSRGLIACQGRTSAINTRPP